MAQKKEFVTKFRSATNAFLDCFELLQALKTEHDTVGATFSDEDIPDGDITAAQLELAVSSVGTLWATFTTSGQHAKNLMLMRR